MHTGNGHEKVLSLKTKKDQDHKVREEVVELTS